MVDVTHSISPQNVLEGAFVLSGIVDYFPQGTIHLAVIDPGVGTDRRLVAVEAGRQWFVLPDNGLISGVLLNHPPARSFAITSPRIARPVVSPTFHGRDLLAPAAAHLVAGNDPAELGPPLDHLVRLANFQPREEPEGLVGEVIFRDTFGNLITNVTAAQLQSIAPLASWTLTLAGERVSGLNLTYGESPAGSLVALTGSTGWVELAVVNGDASRHLSAGPGATVWFHHPRTSPATSPPATNS
jgi:S-adenosylmethionine hydrolase